MKYIITGTSRGIGKQLLITALKNGHQVISISRSKTEIEISTKLVSKWTEIIGDLTKDETFNRLEKELSIWNSVDVLVNNAGYLVNKPFEQLNITDFNLSYQLNILVPSLLIKMCIHFLKQSRIGKVINIGSIGGVQGSVKFPGLAFYSSSKGALATLTECLAEEYKTTNIHFNYLALGAVQTEMLEKAFPGFIAPVTPVQMAEFIYHFSIYSADMINGKIIPVALSTP
jgi:3-oxoacyl-[acyl-carrier protein] reductase